MRRVFLLICIGIVLAACGAPRPVVVVPTLAVLPSVTPTSIASATPAARVAPVASATSIPSPIPTWTPSNAPTPPPTPTDSDTPPPSPTVTFTSSPTGTDTPSATATNTYTPSLTITNTVTPTSSPTFTPSPELDSLGLLALLSERATILPPATLYNPATLTAVAFAAQTLIAASSVTPTPAAGLPGQEATLPPPQQTVNCPTAPPGDLGASFAADPSLAASVGCSQGTPTSLTTAVEAFEHGSMIYLQGSPGSIYVLTLDGRFRRFDDTWVQGVDPETGGETPPLGLIEPKRGFGKVWRNNLDVRGSLGWGVTEEQGATSPVQLFDHGRAVFLPQRGETTLLIDDPGGATGSWRTLPGSF